MTQQAGGFDVNSLMKRIQRMATLDTSVFDEVRGDATSTIPALVIVAISVLSTGIGGWLWYQFQDYNYKAGSVFIKSAILGSIIGALMWFAWVGVTYVLLSQVFRARADINELIRVMGFAMAPLALGILMFIPALDMGIALVALALAFGSTQIAIQTATDAPAGKVLVANAGGFAVWAVILTLFANSNTIYDRLAPGIFLFNPYS